MSGVEVAGLLLGSFPLLISALENYRETAEVLEDWWQIKREYKKCKNEIKVQELAFESNLERFLLPLIVGDDEVSSLLADPGGMRWKDAALEGKLRDRLPKSYELFLDTIYEIQNSMNGMRDELGLDRVELQRNLAPEIEEVGNYHLAGTETDVRFIKKKVHKPRSPLRSLIRREKRGPHKPLPTAGTPEKSLKQWLGRSNFEYQTQRIKFGFGRASRTKLFEEFARLNGRLRELLDTNDHSTTLKQNREQMKKSIVIKAVFRLWRHAASFHRLLDQAWCCQCKHMHRVYLLLHHEVNVETPSYSICFTYAIERLPSLPWTCMAVTAQHVKNTTFTVSQPTHSEHAKKLSSPLQGASSSSKALHPNSKPASRNSTTAGLSLRQKVNWADSSEVLPSATPLTRQRQETEPIDNICSSIAKCGSKTTCLGCLKDNDEESFLIQPDGQSREELYDSISLETLLRDKSALKLDRRQRYTIAFMLVYSHLQLYPSPWLSSQWSKKDIVFIKDADNPGSIMTDQPYMYQDAASSPPSTASTYASRDRLLPTLGILLIELCFGSALEDHEMRRQCQAASSGDGTNPDLMAALDLGVALEWSRLVGGEAGERYADAVQWCLKGQVANAKDDKWREELFTNVVLPVQFCYEQFQPAVEQK